MIGATAVGFFVGLFAALLLAAFQRAEKDPEVYDKLHTLRDSFSLRRQSASTANRGYQDSHDS